MTFEERWSRTARRELVDHLLNFGQRHLERVLAEFCRHDRLGGLLRESRRAA